MNAHVRKYNKILVATDFSPSAESALKQAIWLARQSKASLVLAHTLPDIRKAVHASSYKARMDILYGEGDVFHREIREESDTKMRQIIADLGASDLDIRYETLLGESSVELTHAVQQEGYDLVIAGTRGLSAWQQFFVGSTSSKLIRKCPADVWIVKAEHVGIPEVVLSTTDFSDSSRRAVLRGLEIAKLAKSEFHLLHVIDSMDIPEDLIQRIPQYNSLRSEVNDQATESMEKFIQSLHLDADDVKLVPHLSWGNPAKEIGRIALQLKADLIAIGTVGRGGLKGLFLGNTAESVLAKCDCSILAVKPDGFVSPVAPASWALHPGPEDDTSGKK